MMLGGFGMIKEMNDKIKQNQELKKNATKSRLSREKVHYKKTDNVLSEMTPQEKALQAERLAKYKKFIKRRETISLLAALLTLALIMVLLFVFVL